MPLRHAVNSSLNLENPALPRLLMVDAENGNIWAEVRDHELRARAERDGLASDTKLEALVEHYREQIERLASEAYDAGG